MKEETKGLGSVRRNPKSESVRRETETRKKCEKETGTIR